MEKTMSGLMVETVVKTMLKDLKEDPERTIRKLVDLAHQFSESRFQKHFFETAQTMLGNENSAYYGLVRDLTSYADMDRLLCFGMNLGYNSCTRGAQQIRSNEKLLGHNIPWTVLFQMDIRSVSHFLQYDTAVADGEKLGIYTWMLFSAAISSQSFELARAHPDSAFFLFCEPEEITENFLDLLSERKNVMPVVHYADGQQEIYSKLREMGIPYCVGCPYSQDDLEMILNGDLLASTQQVHPAFTILIPRPDCSDMAQKLTHQAVERARNEQRFQTIPWELERDNRTVDEIISDDACAVSFDAEGFLWKRGERGKDSAENLFEDGLCAVLHTACPKRASEVTAK